MNFSGKNEFPGANFRVEMNFRDPIFVQRNEIAEMNFREEINPEMDPDFHPGYLNGLLWFTNHK